MNDVTFTYRGGSAPSLHEIDLKVSEGEIVMITGPVGAGKSTLCRMLNGLIPHFYEGKLSGRIVVKGIETRNAAIGDLSQHVGLLFQDPASQLICPTIEDEIAFGAENYGVPPDEIERRVQTCIEVLRLKKYAGTSPHNLSGGEQQECALGAIMAMRPSVFVLDEPTSNLDPLGSSQVLSAIAALAKSEKKTIVIVEHKIEELAQIVDRIVVLNDGKIIIDGPPRDVLEQSELMDKIGLKPPQVSLVVKKLRNVSYDRIPISVEEAYEIIHASLKIHRENPTESPQEKIQDNTTDAKTAIEVKDVWFRYEGSEIDVLRDVNLEIRQGEFVGIIGMNGSGKTTLVKHFNGLHKPTKGSVTVFGKDTSRTPIDELAKRVGFVFQNPDHQMFKLKVRDEVAYGPTNLKLPKDNVNSRVRQSLESVDCLDLIDQNTFDLSRGHKQRVNIASVIAMRPDVLIIDEPTTGQDFKRGKQIMEMAKKMNDSGITIVTISHDMNLIAEFVKRIVVMKEGQIILDTRTRSAFANPELLAQTFVKPPQVTTLAQMLGQYGLRSDILTVEELCDSLNQILE